MSYEEWLLSAEYIPGRRESPGYSVRTGHTHLRDGHQVHPGPLGHAGDKGPVPSPHCGGPSHSTGKASLVSPMTVASVAAGAHGVIVDVHPNPSVAKCDGAQALTFDTFTDLMPQVKAVAKAVGKASAAAPA